MIFMTQKTIDVLLMQDMSIKGVEKAINEYRSNSFDFEKDPITGIILQAMHRKQSTDEAILDLDYAIAQLTKARDRLVKYP